MGQRWVRCDEARCKGEQNIPKKYNRLDFFALKDTKSLKICGNF